MGRYTERTDSAVRAVQNVLAAPARGRAVAASRAAGNRQPVHGIGAGAGGGAVAGHRSARVFRAHACWSRSAIAPGAASVAFDPGGAGCATRAELREPVCRSKNWQLIDRTARDYAGPRWPHGDPTRAVDDALAPRLAAVSYGDAGDHRSAGRRHDAATTAWRLLTIGRQIERLAATTSNADLVFRDRRGQPRGRFRPRLGAVRQHDHVPVRATQAARTWTRWSICWYWTAPIRARSPATVQLLGRGNRGR